MTEEDIYKNGKKYERFKANLKSLTTPPQTGDQRKYYCKNSKNLKYFEKLFIHFESRDLSYIRRNRVLDTMKVIVHSIPKDLSHCDRDDINRTMACMHNRYKSVETKKSFIKDLKYIWKILFPELDEKGRPDERIVPYVVRHISGKIDVSKKKLRKDKLTWDEFEKIINYFSSEPRIQAYLTLQLESLARPQELLYRRINEIEYYNSYAKILLSDHGKEGPGFLQCIDSYPYLLKWLGKHPQKNDGEAYIFINTGNTGTLRQMRPENINKMLRKACKDLGINKPITCYSLKRSGVTLRKLRGESDVEIQHAARWTSTKQLKTYDLTDQDDAFNLSLQKRGLIPAQKQTEMPESKKCPFCGEMSGFAETICSKCKHPFERGMVLDEVAKDEEVRTLKATVKNFTSQFETFKQEIMEDLSKQILEKIGPKKQLKSMNI
tara:strand:- start:2282 stop:3589 length:1308 start_codon:yes stop_codon:yes gene_type:complete